MVTPDLPIDDPRTTYAERIEPALASLRTASGAAARAPVTGAAGAAAQPARGLRAPAGKQPVVVVGHSLGAGYAPLVAAAVDGSSLVHLCPAPVGPFAQVDGPMRAYRPGFPFPRNGPDGNSAWEPDSAIAAMYPRLPTDLARSLAQRLKPGSAPTDPYPGGPHPRVPTTFVYATHDEFFEPDWSRWAAREVADVEPIELDTGHFPMFEDADGVAQILLQSLEARTPSD